LAKVVEGSVNSSMDTLWVSDLPEPISQWVYSQILQWYIWIHTSIESCHEC